MMESKTKEGIKDIAGGLGGILIIILSIGLHVALSAIPFVAAYFIIKAII